MNLIEGGKTPLVSVKEAESMGFKIVFFGLTALYSAARGMMDVLKLLKAEENAQSYLDRLITFPQFEEIVNTDKIKTSGGHIPLKGIIEKVALDNRKRWIDATVRKFSNP